MKGILKGVQSVLLAMVVLALIGTGTILWFNNKGNNTEETQTEESTEVSSVDTPENNFPGGIASSPTLSENAVSSNGGTVHEHTYVPSVLKEPSCTTVGQMKYTCSADGDFYIDSIAALEHKPGEWKIVRKATKTVKGLKQQRCVRCNELLKEETINTISGNGTSGNGTSANDPNHRHSYKSTITKEADCFENGTVTYKCACGSTYTLSTPARNHPSRETVVSENGCAAPTTIICSCAICKTIISQDTIPAVGHAFSDWTVTTPPTTEAPGSRSRTCSKCNETQTEAIPQLTEGDIESGAHTHNYDSKITTAATCTEAGVLTHTCPGCKDTYTEPIAALGHNPGNWVTKSESTAETPGLRERYCRRCGELLDSEDIPYVPEHTHSYTSKITKEPTCIATGTKTYTCSVCGEYYTTSIDMVPHKYKDYADGENTITKCSVCGQLKK